MITETHKRGGIERATHTPTAPPPMEHRLTPDACAALSLVILVLTATALILAGTHL